MAANPFATLGKLGDLKRRLWFLLGALVVTTTQACAAMAADRVDLVDEDDARRAADAFSRRL